MKLLAATACAAAALISAPAAAQMMTGEELRGQTVVVDFADGTRNTVFFGSTGAATISNPTTGQTLNGNWYTQGSNLCLAAGGATECWAYTNRFAAGRAVTLASDCGQNAVWTARAVNAPRQEVAPAQQTGERG